MSNEQNPLILMETTSGELIIELYPAAAPKTVDNFLKLASGEKEYTDPVTNKQSTKPFYNGVAFHRVIPSFMIQGGDRKGDGTGGPGYQFEDEISATALGLDKMTIKDAPQYQRELQGVIQKKVFEKLNIHSQQDLDAKRDQANVEFRKMVSDFESKTVEEVLKEAGYQFKNNLPSRKNDKYTLSMANAGPNTNGSQFFINVADNHFLNGKHTVFGKVLGGRAIAETISNVPRDERDKPTTPVAIKKITILSEKK